MDDPADVVKNKHYLVWGVFGWGLPRPYTIGFLKGEEYDYYVARKDLTNYTWTISPGEHQDKFFSSGSTGEPVWYGQDFRGKSISPGTYYIYFILFGKVAQPAPFPLKVLEVYWRS